jgi:hypothetical protein
MQTTSLGPLTVSRLREQLGLDRVTAPLRGR